MVQKQYWKAVPGEDIFRNRFGELWPRPTTFGIRIAEHMFVWLLCFIVFFKVIKKIIWNFYMKTWFIPDLLVVAPFYVYFVLLG